MLRGKGGEQDISRRVDMIRDQIEVCYILGYVSHAIFDIILI